MRTDRRGSRHDRYRDRLAALATDGVPVAAIVEAGRLNGRWSAGQPWGRTYGRFLPDHEPFATMVFETDAEPQLICHVEVFTTRPAPADGRAATVADRPEGWFRVTPFPSDDALPGLPAVLAHPGRRTVVRYRPGSRCTIRIEAPDGRVQFAKVCRDHAGERGHVNGHILWEAARRNELAFEVARPGRWDPGPARRPCPPRTPNGRPLPARQPVHDPNRGARWSGAVRQGLSRSRGGTRPCQWPHPLGGCPPERAGIRGGPPRAVGSRDANAVAGRDPRGSADGRASGSRGREPRPAHGPGGGFPDPIARPTPDRVRPGRPLRSIGSLCRGPERAGTPPRHDRGGAHAGARAGPGGRGGPVAASHPWLAQQDAMGRRHVPSRPDRLRQARVR